MASTDDSGDAQSSSDEEILVSFGRRVVEPSLYAAVAAAQLASRGVTLLSARTTLVVEASVDRQVRVSTSSLVPSDELSARTLEPDERLLLVDGIVHSQRASHFPIDVCVRLFESPATAEFVVERFQDMTSLHHALVPRALAYEHARPPGRVRDPIRFCSLDAYGFPANIREEIASLGAAVALPRTLPYAELIRQVARARQLESLDAVSRACAPTDSLDGHCRVGATLHVYESRAWLDETLDFIERQLRPCGSLEYTEPLPSVRPLGAATWQHALRATDNALLPARASLEAVLWFAVIARPSWPPEARRARAAAEEADQFASALANKRLGCIS